MKTQREKLRRHLEAGRKIDALKAWRLFNILGGFRTRISELRAEGMKIKDTFIKTNNGFYKQYYLEQ